MISSLNILNKPRFLSKDAYKNMSSVLTKMNGRAEIFKANDYIVSAHLRSLDLKIGDATFIDERLFLTKVDVSKQMQKKSYVSLGKTNFTINNENGQILDFHKPFFRKWSKVMEDLDNFFKILNKNFCNKHLIKKNFVIGYLMQNNKNRNILTRIINL